MQAKRIDSRKIRLSAIESLVRHDLMDMREFVDLSERLLKEELNALTQRIDERVPGLPAPDQEAELGWFDDDIYRLSDIFPRIQRYSLFTSLLSMIEQHLRSFCRSAKQVCEVELSASDLKEHGISQSLDYLIKVCHFQISRTAKSEYDHLKMFQMMRNAIMHNNGRPSGKALTSIKQYQKRNPHFDVTERNQITLSSGFLYTVIGSAEMFYKTLLAELAWIPTLVF